MKRRILIHAGFHKTGTTTLQNTFQSNALSLLPHIEVHLRNAPLIEILSSAVLNFSAKRNRDAKAVITKSARLLFASFDMTDPRPIFISSESLSGHFVGAGGVQRYAAAPIAMDLIQNAWHEQTGSKDGFEVYYSTRRHNWLASCHWQRLVHSRLSMDLREFEARFADAADLEKIVKDAQERMPRSIIHTRAIEDLDHPVDPIFDILNLPHLRAQISLPPNANTNPGGDARARLLALNKSSVQDREYRRALNAIINSKTVAQTP